MKISEKATKKVLEIINGSFPPQRIFYVLFDIADDSGIENFPAIKSTLKRIDKGNRIKRISSKALNEIVLYFVIKDEKEFLSFVKKFISEEALDYLDINEKNKFLSSLNYIFEDFNLRVENNKLQKKIILESFSYPEDYNFIDLDVPDHVFDYYSESLNCMLNKTYRSSILFSVFALEASLKYLNELNCPNDNLYSLIKCACEQGFLDAMSDEIDELSDLRDYRNKLVHCAPKDIKFLSQECAKKRVLVDLNLINRSINTIYSN